MSNEKHTPGLWRAKILPSDQGGMHKIYGPPHEDGGDYAPICETRKEYDARLIAAAPDLLKTLQATYGALTPEQKGSALGVIIHESIQRATA